MKLGSPTRHRRAEQTAQQSPAAVTQTLGSATFSIPAGKTIPVKLELNRTWRELLSAAHGRLRATLKIFETSPTSTNTPLIKRVQLTQEQAKAYKK
jgi:hypothetical protein